jgi:Zn-dependent M16 (insulinase) family peptidase
MKNDNDSSLAAMGHHYASGRTGKLFSRSRAVDEVWNGLNQIPFSHYLAKMDMKELRDRLTSIRNTLVAGGLFLNLTTSNDAMKTVQKAAETLNTFGSPRPANQLCLKKEHFFSLVQKSRDGNKPEVFASPSLQVGFAAVSFSASPYGSPEQAAELVFSHELSTGALWESIRMIGGAYGAFAHPDSLEGVYTVSTYRDPDPLRSIIALPEILKKRSLEEIDEDILEKVIIGSYARETRPHSPAEKSFSELIRRLYGITDDQRLTKLKYISSLDGENLNAAARRIAEAAQTEKKNPVSGSSACLSIIAGKTTAHGAAKKLGTEVKELPI